MATRLTVCPTRHEDKTGFPLQLTLTVVDDDTCAPLGNALVEIWHCDALGEYSGFVGNNGPTSPTTARSSAAAS